jgi:hypothetical protein
VAIAALPAWSPRGQSEEKKELFDSFSFLERLRGCFLKKKIIEKALERESART